MDTCITVWPMPKHPRWYDEGMRESLTWVREAGFTHINYTIDGGSSYMFSTYEIDFTADMVRDAGLKVKTLHGSNGRNHILEVASRKDATPVMESRRDIGSVHEWQRLGGVELLQNRIDMAAALGAPDIVLHIDMADEVFRTVQSEAAFFDPFWKSFDALAPYCQDHAVKIAVENLMGASAETWLTLYDRLFARYPADVIGLCFDTGHWRVAAGADDMSLLEHFGHRLISTHIHDNFGTLDDHLLPFEGCIDWVKVMHAIAATPYETPLNLETPADRHSLAELPFYKRAQAAAVRLEQMIADARKD